MYILSGYTFHIVKMTRYLEEKTFALPTLCPILTLNKNIGKNDPTADGISLSGEDRILKKIFLSRKM